jgi:uncharacterized membrane protein SirB2
MYPFRASLSILFLIFLVFFSQPQIAWGAIAQPEQVPLTLELLQERLRSPLQSEGVRTLDLRRVVIDLRPENAAFRDQFYRLIQAQLQRSRNATTGEMTAPLGLDLSYSTIKGELNISELGLRSPLYGQELSPLLSEAEQAQLKRDRRRLSQLSQLSRSLLIQGQPTSLQITVFRGALKLVQTRFEGFVNFTNAFFLGRVEAPGAEFVQESDWSETRFSQPANFTGAIFRREARFRNTIFFERAGFNLGRFQAVNFQGSEFRATANFSQSTFQQTANFNRIQWQGNADFAQTDWQSSVFFNRSKFSQALFLSEATFEKLISFREAQFSQPVNLRGANILDQADFGDASFAKAAYLNVTGLQFNSEEARILGDPGQVGRVLSVPTLQGNETLLRNLVRNFRLLEQIADANQVEYTRERLRLRQLQQQLWGTNLNTATLERLQQVGFSPVQAEAIAQFRTQQVFRNLPDLLRLNEIDLATYVKVRDRVVVSEPRSPVGWTLDALHWLGLSLLLLLSRYGTDFWLSFGVGMVALAYFGGLFWLIDRLRRFHPKPIVPTLSESIWVTSSFSLLSLLGLAAIFRTSEQPWLTLTCLAIVIIPIPVALLFLVYQQGRYHDLMDRSYFVEDGSLRQFRLLIGRLPNMPRFVFFRDRYMPILWDRRWNWLNYFDFSLNNLLKFGFNDIRLRDEHLPGLINTLAWYQWLLGILYIALLLWTLSRTIPGLNLLIYFK